MEKRDIDRLIRELETLAFQYRAAAQSRRFDTEEMFHWIRLANHCWDAVDHLAYPQRKG